MSQTPHNLFISLQNEPDFSQNLRDVRVDVLYSPLNNGGALFLVSSSTVS
jgi:hypothetical protein